LHAPGKRRFSILLQAGFPGIDSMDHEDQPGNWLQLRSGATSQFAARWYSLLLVIGHAAAWSAALFLAAMVFLRIFWFDGTILLVYFNAFTLYVYLPAYACLLWAWKFRRPVLAAVSLAPIFCQAWLIIPELFLPAGGLRQTTVAGKAAKTIDWTRVRIFFANVRSVNRQIDPMLEEIAGADPDIVLLAEFSHPWQQATGRAEFMKKYPYSYKTANYGGNANGIFSRFPLKHRKSVGVQLSRAITVDVEVGGEILHVLELHAPHLVFSSTEPYFEFWRRCQEVVLELPRPLVVIGDFNATQFSAVYEQMTSGDLRGAHADRGRGSAVTWPNGRFRIPPIRIDHALLSDQVQCLAIVEGRGEGSDHRPLILDIDIGF
jgi:endonuclease/exonuclease/phosphatase (EEP) superfamily protein YafD